MTHKTLGIVLRSVKYGETSLVVSIYTELFGLQSYLVNGVRSISKKGSVKSSLYQPAAILDMVVYHNELKNLQRIKEVKWNHLYKNIFYDVIKNSVALYMVELLYKCIKQPEANADLFSFLEDAFLSLDECGQMVLANHPLYFTLHLASFFGLRITDNYAEGSSILDLNEGFFVPEKPDHKHFLDGKLSLATSQLLKTMQPAELDQLKLNKETRRILLHAYEAFFGLHIQDFGTLRTLPVLHELLS